VTRQYAISYVAKLRLLKVMYTLAPLRSKIQRTNPVIDEAAYNKMFATLIELEMKAKELKVLSTGE
jgi:DNA primase